MMKSTDIIRYRLHNQQIAGTKLRNPLEIVERLGAVQAQDYSGGLWGIRLRLPGSKLVDIEKALINRKIIRTWPMRGTLHFVPARDARWMLELLTPRVIRRSAGRYKELGLNVDEWRARTGLMHMSDESVEQRWPMDDRGGEGHAPRREASAHVARAQ